MKELATFLVYTGAALGGAGLLIGFCMWEAAPVSRGLVAGMGLTLLGSLLELARDLIAWRREKR